MIFSFFNYFKILIKIFLIYKTVSDGFAEKTSDSNLQNKLSQLNTFNSQENLDNNPNEGSLSKQHEVSIEFQLNKEEKDAAIMQRKCSSMSQNSSNKPDNLSN